MVVPCKREEPAFTIFNNGFEFRRLNKKITGVVIEDNSFEIAFIRILSKEEQEKLKDAPLLSSTFIVKGKIFVSIIRFSRETMCDLSGIFSHLADHIDGMKYDPAAVGIILKKDE